MMKKLARIGWILAALLMAGTAACRRDQAEPLTSELNIYIQIPGRTVTRGEIGDVLSEQEGEDLIHTLQIWVYLHEAAGGHPAGHLLGYLNPSPNFLHTGTVNRFFLSIENEVAEANPTVDVYVLGNATSAGFATLDVNTTASDLDGLLMQGNVFGISANAPTCSAVPSTGLPFSGVGKALQMTGEYPVLTLPAVEIKRAVSKLRFVFSQLSDENGPVAEFNVTGIKLNGNGIAKEEYLINDNENLPYKITPGQYEPSELVFPALGPSQIANNLYPLDYAYVNQDAQTYEDLIMSGLADGVLTSGGFCYLRESDIQLSGEISYTIRTPAEVAAGVPATEEHLPFTMQTAGDFARNHTWIIYAYFLYGRLQFSISWTDWVHGQDFELNY